MEALYLQILLFACRTCSSVYLSLFSFLSNTFKLWTLGGGFLIILRGCCRDDSALRGICDLLICIRVPHSDFSSWRGCVHWRARLYEKFDDGICEQ